MSNHANQSVTNVASTALNFSDVYLSHLSKIKACIRKLDHKAGFKRSTDQTDELAQDFFTKVWADSILDYFTSIGIEMEILTKTSAISDRIKRNFLAIKTSIFQLLKKVVK